MLRDLKTALRSLRAAPVTTAAAVLVVALGTGANLAVLAVGWGVLLRPLAYPEASRLAILSIAAADGADFGFELADVDAWTSRLRTVEAVAGFATGERTLRGGGEPRLVRTAFVTAGFFDVLGVAPLHGRLPSFRESDDVIALSERLGADLDRPTVDLDGRALSVAGVLGRPFDFPSEEVEAWVPAVAEGAAGSADQRRFRLVARRAAGVSLAQLHEDALRVLRELRGAEVVQAGLVRPTVVSVEDALLGEVRPVLGASLAAAVLVLAVTCGNVAMILLGRAALRRRDAAVRRALGAGAWQLARGSLAESLVLASTGSLLGLGLAHLALGAFRRVAAGVVPRARDLALDAPVLAAAVVLVAVVALLCGAAPALHTARRDFAAAFRAARTGEPRTRRVLASLVVGQIAVSLVLITGAALLGRTVVRLLNEDAGFDPERVLAVALPLERGSLGPRAAAGTATSTAADTSAFVRDVLARVRALPGVRTAGIGSSLPPAGRPFQIHVHWRTATRDDGLTMSTVSATPGFLETLGTRLVNGRLFTSADERVEDPVVLVSESTARFMAPGEDLAGREIATGLPPIASWSAPPRVVGVVADVKHLGLDLPASAAVYLPWTARPETSAHLVVRAQSDPRSLAPALRQILRELDPELPIPEIRTLAEEMSRSIADRRLRVMPALAFAGVALLVALGGIFALFTRAAAERRRELAIRLALGASRRDLRGLILGRALVLTGAGIAAGLAGSVAVAKGLRGLLYGVGPHDPPTLLAVVVLVASTSILAAWLPARRAARVEPGELLRSE